MTITSVTISSLSLTNDKKNEGGHDNKDNLDAAKAKMVLAKLKTRLISILNFV